MEAMASLWDDVKNAIVDGYVYASDKAEELTHVGKARVEILRLNRQIAHTMSEVGGMVFEHFDKHKEAAIIDDEAIVESVDKIKGYRSEIKKLEKEIKKAKAAREVKTE
jgi:hypothetical protein